MKKGSCLSKDTTWIDNHECFVVEEETRRKEVIVEV